MRTILVSAYSCEPLKGSEPAVGWNWVLQLGKRNRVHVITRANNQRVIERHLPKNLSKNVIFHYYDTPAFIKKLKNKDKGLYFYNFCWQIGIVNVAKRIIQDEHVDYILHLTFGSMWMPTFLPFLSPKFIWGPMGGGECVPFSFIGVLPFKQRVVQMFRYILNYSTIINPLILLPACKAKVILARTPNTKAIMPFFVKKKTKVLLETAMEESVFQREKKLYESDIINMVISARFISIKNIPLVIKSLKYISTSKPWKLTLLGSGPDRELILRTIKEEGYGDRVNIISMLPREEALDLIVNSDIFIFPSLKEGGTWALMEAMAMGLPVVCVNWAGMAVETTPETAIQIPVSSPKTMEREMGAAISLLINNRSEREKMGQSARQRIRDVFNWDAKGLYMEKLFDEIESNTI
mgnify:CR=1 FL=1|jgi:glycosyltransferase, group 1 family